MTDLNDSMNSDFSDDNENSTKKLKNGKKAM